MTRIKMHIFKAKLRFYLLGEVKCRLQNEVSTKSSTTGLAVVEGILLQFWHQRRWVLPLLQPWTQFDDGTFPNTDKREKKRNNRGGTRWVFLSFLTTQKNTCTNEGKFFFFSPSPLCRWKSRREDVEEEVLSLFPFWWCQNKVEEGKTPLSLFYFSTCLSLSVSLPWQKIMGKWQN